MARGTLRTILGRYLALAPAHLRFSYNAFGKPELSIASGQKPLRFNLAHSHGRALLGVARGRDIGVDLEWIRDDFDPLPIVRQFFFGTELTAIQSAPPGLLRDAFYRHWVAKEAVLKAQGSGLSVPLDSFWVTFEADGNYNQADATGFINLFGLPIKMNALLRS